MPITKTVMNVDSLVANDSASSAPISAGWWRRGRSRKRKMTTISAERDRRRCRCPRARSARSTGTSARTRAAPPPRTRRPRPSWRAQPVRQRDHRRAHQRRGEPRGEVRVAEQHVRSPPSGRSAAARAAAGCRRSRRVWKIHEKYASWLSSWWNGRSPRSIQPQRPARRPRAATQAMSSPRGRRRPARRAPRRGCGARRRGASRRRPRPVRSCRRPAVAGDEQHEADERDRHDDDEAQHHEVGDRRRARAAERLDADGAAASCVPA